LAASLYAVFFSWLYSPARADKKTDRSGTGAEGNRRKPSFRKKEIEEEEQ